MKQFQLDFWNEFKKIFCYHTGVRELCERTVKPWKKYDRLVDIPIEEMKEIIKMEKVKTLIVDMDGTLKYYKLGLLDENKKWIQEIKKIVNIYIISNANESLTSKVANELQVEYVCNAKKPSPYGFEKICKLSNSKKEEVIVIGDAIRADIKGAQRAGIEKTILLKDLNIIGIEKGKNQYDSFYYITFNFILYSFIGWIIEMIYHIGKGIYENRGFLFGPFCIIYGISALIMLAIYPKIKGKNKIVKAILLWIYTFIICSVFEYITSYVIELIFGIRLWDYTGLSFNIDGRVRLITSIAWANCSIVLIYWIQPFVEKIFNKLKKKSLFNTILHSILWIMFIDWICAIVRYS